MTSDTAAGRLNAPAIPGYLSADKRLRQFLQLELSSPPLHQNGMLAC